MKALGGAYYPRAPDHTSLVGPIHMYQIQSTLVISTSIISSNRLSRRENLVLL